MMNRFSCFAFFLFVSCVVFGQKDSVTTLDEVILLEDFAPKKVKGITPSATIGPVVLEKFSPIDVASGLNQIPGVYMLSGALNTNRITIRGVGARTPFGTDKLRLYFDGIPVTNGTGFSTIEAFDLENLDMVEVIKGPKGTSFGANLGGAILLNSKNPDTDETRLMNHFTVGSYHMLKDNVTFQHSEKGFTLNLSFNHLETDGYRQNSRFERNGLLLNSSFHTSDKNKLGFLMNYIDYTAQIPSSLNETDFRENPTAAAANWLAAQGFEANKYLLLGLSNQYIFNGRFKNTSSIFYSYLDHYEPRPFNILDEFTNGYGFRTVFEGNFSEENQYSFGSEFYRDEYNWSTFENLFRDNNGNGSLQGDRLSKNREFRRQFNAFGTLTLAFSPKLYGQLGLAFNQTVYDFRDLFNSGSENTSARRDFDAILLPSLGLRYHIKYGHLFANISRGFSNPGLEETLTPNGIINPDIAQETGMNYEIGASFRFPKQRIALEVALYRMDIDNLLVAQRVGEDQFIGRNAGETRHQGFELAVNHSFELSKTITISPYVNYTFSDHVFVDFVQEGNDFSGNPLTGVPKHRINSGFTLRHSSGFEWGLNHQFVDEIPLTDANTFSSESFNVFFTSVRYRKALFKNMALGINAGLNNLFDTNYAQSVLINAVGFGGSQPRYFYPGNGRNYYGSILLNYVF